MSTKDDNYDVKRWCFTRCDLIWSLNIGTLRNFANVIPFLKHISCRHRTCSKLAIKGTERLYVLSKYSFQTCEVHYTYQHYIQAFEVRTWFAIKIASSVISNRIASLFLITTASIGPKVFVIRIYTVITANSIAIFDLHVATAVVTSNSDFSFTSAVLAGFSRALYLPLIWIPLQNSEAPKGFFVVLPYIFEPPPFRRGRLNKLLIFVKQIGLWYVFVLNYISKLCSDKLYNVLWYISNSHKFPENIR